MRALVLMFFSLVFCMHVNAQKKITISGHDETIYPLQPAAKVELKLPEEIRTLFSSKTIVGLGEATHGTLEFSQIRALLFKYLVQECGYRSIIFEASTGSVGFINDYVHGRGGKIDSLLRRVNSWILYTDEVKLLVNWIRYFNEGKTAENQVSVYGLDMQFPSMELSFFYQKIQSSRYPGNNSLQQIVGDDAKYFDADKLQDFYGNPAFSQAISRMIPLINNWFSANKTALTQYLDQETIQLMEISITNSLNGEKIGSADLHYRDSCMAINVSKLQSIKGAKTAIWAHNGHISKADPQIGYDRFRKSMGEFLNQQFSDKYYPIGFVFGEGKFLALVQKKSKTSYVYPGLKEFTLPATGSDYLSALFTGSGEKSFFIDLSQSSNPAWKKYYRTYTQPATYLKGKNYAYYITPGFAFSALVYVDMTSASAQVDEHFYKILE